MSLFEQFKLDEKKVAEGVLITYAPNSDGTIPAFRVLRRGPSNQRYAKVLERETMPYRRMIELGTLDNMIAEQIFLKVFCLSVLINWEHVQDEKGLEIAFNFDNAMTLFRKLPELYDDLMAQSIKVSLFREYATENDAKN